jgi:hypothetical protein
MTNKHQERTKDRQKVEHRAKSTVNMMHLKQGVSTGSHHQNFITYLRIIEEVVPASVDNEAKPESGRGKTKQAAEP